MFLANEAALVLPHFKAGGDAGVDAPARRASEAAANGRAEAPPSHVAGLVDAARAGDRSAFAELYRSHLRMVHGVLLARVPREDVDDLVQDVFLSAMRRLETLRNPAAFPGWLATIARNLAIDHLRRRPAETVELPENLPAVERDEERARAVLAIVRSLPEAYREPLVLRLVEGMTGAEIAARTGLTEGSVRVNLHRGMRLLRARLDEGATP